MKKTYNVLSDLFPYKSKPIKRQKNTKFNKLYKKAERVGLSLKHLKKLNLILIVLKGEK